MSARVQRTIASLLAAGLIATLVGAAIPSAASPTEPPQQSSVGSRRVSFELTNSNSTPVACRSDNASYRVGARIVAPRGAFRISSLPRINVLVHDNATSGWFWNLRDKPRYDYAGNLARSGEVSVVLDRLGYAGNRIPNGDDTCLGAQADMLHQVIQHLRSGRYDYRGSRADQATPSAQHVVVHGHAVGAAIAQVEAGTFDDVDALVLMSWADSGASQRAVDEASAQSNRCLAGDDYAFFGETTQDFRALLFRTAPRGVQRAAASRRGPTPCGDALSLSQLVSGSSSAAQKIEVPVLLLFGARDVLMRDGSAASQSEAYGPDVTVTTKVVPGAASALVLEKSAPRTRAKVQRWLNRLG